MSSRGGVEQRDLGGENDVILSPARSRRRVARRGRWIRRLSATTTLVVVAAVVGVAIAEGSGNPESAKPASHARRATAFRRPPKPKPPPPPILLPRGGRVLLPGHLVVAYYGIVGTSNVLGRTSDPEADAAGVERQASAYARFGLPVQPAFELVTTIASPYPGPQDTYSSTLDRQTLDTYVRAAHRHRLLLILDFQPGRGEFLPQVERYARYLLDPGVGVALDPEWKLTSDEVPDQVIGSSSAASINAVSRYLARFVAVHHLPQKLFIVHEFRLTELPDRQKIEIQPNLATVLQMDGFGPVSTKLDSYHMVMRDAGTFYPGFKVFLRPVDDPVLMTPTQIMALNPRPDYISYQ